MNFAKKILRLLPSKFDGKSHLFLFAISAKFLLLSAICFYFGGELRDFFKSDLESRLTLRTDESDSYSQFVQFWLEPPIIPRLKIYVFNVTNSEDFMRQRSGERVKPILREIGPFVYSATQKREILKAENGSVTFRSKTTYRFLPEESAFHHEGLKLTVPNMVFFSGMLKSEVIPQSGFIKKNVVWPLLTESVTNPNLTKGSSMFLNLTPKEFIWGYQEEMACLADDFDITGSSSDDSEDDWFGDDGGDDWFRRKKRSSGERKADKRPAPNFRRGDGSCMFGILSTLNDTWGETIRIQTGEISGLKSRGKILEVNGQKGFGAWKEERCDRLPEDYQEPTVFAGKLNADSFIDFHLGLICRPIRLKVLDKNPVGMFNAVKYESPNDTFSNSDSCYGSEPLKSLMKPGVMHLGGCAEDAPMAVSFPHFYGADSWYREAVSGVAEPSAERDGTFFLIEPRLGVPLAAKVRFQLNLVVVGDRHFEPLAALPEDEVAAVLPVMWAEEGFEGIPFFSGSVLLAVALFTGPAVSILIPVVSLYFSIYFAFAGVKAMRNEKYQRPENVESDEKKSIIKKKTKYHLVSERSKIVPIESGEKAKLALLTQ